MRNLGGSIGIAFVTTMLARGAQVHQALMVGHLTPRLIRPTSPRMAAGKHMLALHADPVTATRQAYGAIYSLLDQQAHLWAFVDNFFLFGVLALARHSADFLVQAGPVSPEAAGRRGALICLNYFRVLGV